MNVALFVAPLLDPEEEDEQAIERIEAILDDFNTQLRALGLPPYEDPGTFTEDVETWSAMLDQQWLINLHQVLAAFAREGKLGAGLKHLLDPAERGVMYFPVDFAEPIPSTVDPEMVYGSCQALRREVEAVAAHLGIPLDRFALDLSGGADKESEWLAVFEDLAEAGAPCAKFVWGRTDAESVRRQIHEYCEASDTDEAAFTQSLIDEHGSLEEYAAALRAELPSDEEYNIGLVFTVVGFAHGCQYAIDHGLTLGIG